MKAFVSCSLHSDDSVLVTNFKSLLWQEGIEPVTVGQEVIVPPHEIVDAIKREIKSSDCLIMLGTPRYLTSDYKQKMSEALPQETFMAFMVNKPVLAFIQKGVDFRGLLHYVNPSDIPIVGFDENTTCESIADYFNYIKNKVIALKSKESSEKFLKIIVIGGLLGLGFYACYKLGESRGRAME